MDVAGQRVFVVGGSMGIGLASAKRFAAGGAHVTIFARRRGPLDEARAACESARRDRSQRIEARELDVRDAAHVAGVFGGLVALHGPPAVLLNCAGRAYPKRFEEITAEAFADTMQTNLHGCWHTASAVVPAMKAAGGGYIVNTASLAGLIGVYGYTDYCASKFAIVGFSEALRSELKPHRIMVSVLCPPDVDTPGFAVENTTKPPETVAVSEGAKLMTPDEVAAELFAGMARRLPLIIPGRDARRSALAKRLVPGVVERTMDRAIGRVRR